MFSFWKKTDKKSTPTSPTSIQKQDLDKDAEELKYTVYGKTKKQNNVTNKPWWIIVILDFIRTIKDPEKPSTLEELNVVYEEGVFVS